MRIVGTPLASGSVTGLPVGKYYVYGGDKPIRDGDRGVIKGPKGGAKVRAEERLKRMAEYGRLRDQGVGHAEAYEQIGVQRKTAARYKAAWLATPCDHAFRDSCPRCKERQEAADLEAVRRAGREAWRIHHEREEAP